MEGKKIMKQKSGRLLLLVLAAMMTISMAACVPVSPGAAVTPTPTATQSGGTPVPTEKPKELVKLTMYPEAGNVSSGVVGGWKGDYFASLGLQLEVWAYSDEKTNAILASSDLTDIMYVTAKNRDVMIEANMLLKLDDYLDKMPHAKAYKPLGTALNHARQFLSAGTGSLYGLPTSVGDNSTKVSLADSTERNAVKLKWDVYEKIGAPKSMTLGDLIRCHRSDDESVPHG